jgi:Dipeptidyl aminopeptidases/acylaminoacyl-peptidases
MSIQPFGVGTILWLAPEFSDWNIAHEVAKISAPVLVIHGEEDEYGGVSQAETIAREVAHGELLLLPGVGHSPQRERPRDVLAACQAFLLEHTLT